MLGRHQHNICPNWLLHWHWGIVICSARKILDLGPQRVIGPRNKILIITSVDAIAI